jgi:hypothetical protein
MPDSALAPLTNREGTPHYRRTDQAKPRNESLCLNEIWLVARLKWEAAGRPDGDSSRFWQEAEKELLEGRHTTSTNHVEQAAGAGK